jgi:hypothetical protein
MLQDIIRAALACDGGYLSAALTTLRHSSFYPCLFIAPDAPPTNLSRRGMQHEVRHEYEEPRRSYSIRLRYCN